MGFGKLKNLFKKKKTQTKIHIDKLVEHKFPKGSHYSDKNFIKKWNSNTLTYKVVFTKRSLYNKTEGDWNKMMYMATPNIIPNHSVDGFCVAWNGDTYKDDEKMELTCYFHDSSKQWDKIDDNLVVPLNTEVTITQWLGNNDFNWRIEFNGVKYEFSHSRKNKKKVSWLYSSYITAPYFGGSVPTQKLTTLKISDVDTIFY